MTVLKMDAPTAMTSPNPISLAAQLERVQVTFDGFASLALTDINLEVGRGEILGLIGPEGGKVKVFGGSPRRSAIRARIGYLPQNSAQPHYHGLFALLGRSLRRLKPVAERPVGADPGGRRVDQLLLKRPELVVLDEPFAGLDAAATLELKARLGALVRQGKTVILSDRWLSPAMDMCDQMAILYKGQIQAAGSLAQLLAAPGAIRILGPVLPPDSAERVLTTMRGELLGQAGLPDPGAAGPGVPLAPPNSQSKENPIFAALTPSEPTHEGRGQR